MTSTPEKKSPNLKFSNKLVVITGSGTGIGQAIAKKFAENGANIVIMGRRKEPLDQTTEILNEIIQRVSSDGIVKAYPGVDVSDETGINQMFENIRQDFGKVDILVNNAGVSGPVKTFTNASFQDFKDCVAIHLTGTFWTSVQSLKVMEKGSKIITIATFFTEENKYEQRPYRFRTPYTASQGAKNRLSEALAWELAEKGIKSVATNPGPVHSDRIYKTVYPKAAAEFLRIGGYPGLNSVEIEKCAVQGLELLGEPTDVFSEGIKKIAATISSDRSQNTGSENSGNADITNTELTKIINGMITKIQEIAEKIQNNTSKMIVDNEFLSQEEVADMVITLSDDKISKLINGRVIPNDRVFYPVKPIIGTSIDKGSFENLKNKVVVITTTSSNKRDVDRVTNIANELNTIGVKQVIILTNNPADLQHYNSFHSHSINLSDEDKVRMIFNTAKTKFGNIDAVIHVTGDYDYTKDLNSLTRSEWEDLVNNYIHIPGLLTKEAVRALAPEGATHEPSKYKNSTGIIVLLGPDSPTGKKISGLLRARSEVFRGALRPYTATVNQELSDVLGSNIRLYLVLPGNIEGVESRLDNVTNSILNLVSGSALHRNESIFCIDEAKK